MPAPKGNKNGVGNKGGGRTSNLSEDKFGIDIINAFKSLLEEDGSKVMYMWTDEDIREELNLRLRGEGVVYQISPSTFNLWKSADGDFAKKWPLVFVFIESYKKAIRNAKLELHDKMLLDDKWQRFAWILERKFEAWNLKKISEVTHDIGPSLGEFKGFEFLP